MLEFQHLFCFAMLSYCYIPSGSVLSILYHAPRSDSYPKTVAFGGEGGAPPVVRVLHSRMF